jgi:hypothetical protein
MKAGEVFDEVDHRRSVPGSDFQTGPGEAAQLHG